MARPTHYDLLGVAPDATDNAVRAAYLRRARSLHPDANPDRSNDELARREADLRRVNEAWQILKDPTRRRAYDATLPTASSSPPKPTPRTKPPEPNPADEEPMVVSPTAAMLLRIGPALLLGLVLLALLVFTAVARTDGGDDRTDTIERCVTVDARGVVAAPCDVANGTIVAEANRADACPELSVAFASDRPGVLWCVEVDGQ